MASRFSRVRFGVAVGTAFVFGLLFASGLDLTRFGFAQEGKGAKVTLETNGPDEAEAMEALVTLINDCFGEGQ